MSTDYNLDIATPLNPTEIRERLCDLLSARVFGDNLLDADGLVISVRAIGDYRREVLDETYAFTPTADIQFTVDRAHPDNAVRTMLRGAFALFATAGTSGVLLANGETPLMMRENDRIYIDNDAFWTDENLALISFAYEKKKLPAL